MTLSPYPSQWATFIRVFEQHPSESDLDYACRLVGYAHGLSKSTAYIKRSYPQEVSDCQSTILTHYHILRAEPYDTSLSPFYFTFGAAHVDKNNNPLFNSYCIIYADNENNARLIMHQLRGEKWATSYTNPVSARVDFFNLHQVSIESITLQPHIQLA